MSSLPGDGKLGQCPYPMSSRLILFTDIICSDIKRAAERKHRFSPSMTEGKAALKNHSLGTGVLLLFFGFKLDWREKLSGGSLRGCTKTRL